MRRINEIVQAIALAADTYFEKTRQYPEYLVLSDEDHFILKQSINYLDTLDLSGQRGAKYLGIKIIPASQTIFLKEEV